MSNKRYVMVLVVAGALGSCMLAGCASNAPEVGQLPDESGGARQNTVVATGGHAISGDFGKAGTAGASEVSAMAGTAGAAGAFATDP